MKANNMTIEDLTRQIPTLLQYKYTIVPDQINCKTFALAKIAEDYKRSDYYAHTPITDYMTEKEMAAYLRGMQLQIYMFRTNKIN